MPLSTGALDFPRQPWAETGPRSMRQALWGASFSWLLLSSCLLSIKCLTLMRDPCALLFLTWYFENFQACRKIMGIVQWTNTYTSFTQVLWLLTSAQVCVRAPSHSIAVIILLNYSRVNGRHHSPCSYIPMNFSVYLLKSGMFSNNHNAKIKFREFNIDTLPPLYGPHSVLFS